MKSLEEKIKSIVSEKLGVSPEELTSESQFTTDLGADQVEVADLLTAIEEKLAINLPKEEKEKVKTLGRLIGLVASQTGDFENETD